MRTLRKSLLCKKQVIVQGTPEFVESLPPVEEFTDPVYNEVHHEQIVAGEMTQDIIGNSAVQEQVIVQEIHSIVEQVLEQIVETIYFISKDSQFAPNTSSSSTSQFDITSSSSTSTGIEQFTELGKIETLTKRLLEPPLVEPPILEPSLGESPDLTSAERRRRTRYTPLLEIMEHAVYVVPSAWPPIRHA